MRWIGRIELALVLALTLAGVLLPAWAQTPVPGVIHVAKEPGESLARIAGAYGVPVEVLAELNGIAPSARLDAGERILVPGGRLPGGPGLYVRPYPFVQGQAATVLVYPCPALPQGSFAAQELSFVRDGDFCVALVGVHALAKAGRYGLTVRVGEGPAGSFSVRVVEAGYPVEVIRLGKEKRALLKPDLVAQEREVVSRAFAASEGLPRWLAPFSHPLRGHHPVTSLFGFRRSYNGAPPRGFHAGVDFRASEGTPVYAPAPGRVVLARKLSLRGNAVILDHGAGVMSGFWHLSELAVSEGVEVQRGDLIGRVGSTGLSTGPHLHWELRVNGVAVNPLPWLDEDPWMRRQHRLPIPCPAHHCPAEP